MSSYQTKDDEFKFNVGRKKFKMHIEGKGNNDGMNNEKQKKERNYFVFQADRNYITFEIYVRGIS